MKTYENRNQVGKEANDVAAKLDSLTEALLSKAREVLGAGSSEGRREIVKTTLRLERMLGEVMP